MPPYVLYRDGDDWLLVDTETGEIVDDFGDNEALARQTLHEQLTA